MRQTLLLITLCITSQTGLGDPCKLPTRLQVLGSGGPELQDQRASASYLVWIENKPTVLVDMGGGSALRFGQAGANLADLQVILFTHLHVDHVVDFAALVNYQHEMQPGARRFDVGERSNFTLMPMSKAALQQIHGTRPGVNKGRTT